MTLADLIVELKIEPAAAACVAARFGGSPTGPLTKACADSIRAEFSATPWESELGPVFDKGQVAAAIGVRDSDIHNARRQLIAAGCKWRKMKRAHRNGVAKVVYFDAQDMAVARAFFARRQADLSDCGKLITGRPVRQAVVEHPPETVDKVTRQLELNKGVLTVAWVVRHCGLPHESAWRLLNTARGGAR